VSSCCYRLQVSPSSSAALHCLAKALLAPEVAQEISAYRALRRCLSLNPSDTDACCTLAAFQAYYMSDVEAALETYDRSHELNLCACSTK
jgi:thioredoxin-like negative regulator of GroEL